jgi:hypothetical protein
MYWHASRKSLDNEDLVLPWSQLSDAEPWVGLEERDRAIECGSFQPDFAFVVEAEAWSDDVEGFVRSGLPFMDPGRVWVYEVAPENLRADQSSLDPPAGSMSCSQARIIRRIWPE